MQPLIIGGVPEHFNAPWHYALSHGALKPRSNTIQFQDYPEGTGAMCQDLQAGSLDIAIVLTEGILKYQAQHDDCKIIAPYVDTPLTWGIYASAHSDIHELSEFTTPRFAVSRMGSGSHLMSYLLVKQLSTTLQSNQIQFNAVGGIEQLIAAVHEDTQSVFLWETYTTEPWVKPHQLRKIGELPSPWPCFQIAVRRATLEANRSLIDEILQAIFTTNQQFNSDHDLAASQITQRYGLADERVRQWLQTTKWSTQIPDDYAKQLKNYHHMIEEMLLHD